MTKIKKYIILILIALIASFDACNNLGEILPETSETKAEVESSTTLEEFVLTDDLESAITLLALKFESFDASTTKEAYYPELFISSYCKNSRWSCDYLDKVEKEKNGRLSREQVEHIQYSLTNEFVDFSNYIGEEGLDSSNKSAGVLGVGEITSYGAKLNGDEVKLAAQLEFKGDNYEWTKQAKLYELNVTLVKNDESCFGGYSVKALARKDITPVITGDNKEHTFYGTDMGIEDNGVFIIECSGGEADVIYGTHVEIDLSANPALAEFVRANAMKEFDVTYVWDDSVAQPVVKVIPIDLKLHDNK